MIAALLGVGIASTPAGDMVYKCTTQLGTTTYSDTLCPIEDKCGKWTGTGFEEKECHADIVERQSTIVQERKAAATAEYISACRRSATCWADQTNTLPLSKCRDLIERRAKFQFKWIDGWLTAKFDHTEWDDEQAGTIAFSGDWIQMQNGFGAWQRMNYTCVIDPATKNVTRVDISPRS